MQQALCPFQLEGSNSACYKNHVGLLASHWLTAGQKAQCPPETSGGRRVGNRALPPFPDEDHQ